MKTIDIMAVILWFLFLVNIIIAIHNMYNLREELKELDKIQKEIEGRE